MTSKKKEETATEEFNYNYDAEAAIEADKGRELTGPFECTIAEAVVDKTKNDAMFISLKVTIDGRTNQEGNLVKYSLGSNIDERRIYLTSGKAKGCSPIKSKAIMDAIFELTGAKPTTGLADAQRYDFDEEGWVTEQKMQFTDLLGKSVGVIIQQDYVYGNKLINGYTKEEFPRNSDLTVEEDIVYQDAKKDPECIWVQNKDSKYKNVFIFVRWFNVATGQTLSEIKNEKEPAKIVKLVNKLYEADSTPMDKMALDKFVIDAMKKKFGKKYDPEKMETYSGVDVDGDAPF